MQNRLTMIPCDRSQDPQRPRTHHSDFPQEILRLAQDKNPNLHFSLLHHFSHFAPKSPLQNPRSGADILSIFGWRYQKQGCQIGILRILPETRKIILSIFGGRYQKRGFLPPNSTRLPSHTDPEFHILRHAKNKLTTDHLHQSPPLPARISEFITHHSEFSSPLSLIAIPANAVILPAMTTTSSHTWRFFRAGGFDQVRIDSGDDIANLPNLDKKLWVALACPTRGLEFDHKTLDFIDTDNDARIRAPELLAATTWTVSLLKNPDQLTKSSPTLPLAAINDSTPEGKQLLASARQILLNLGKSNTDEISPDDTADTVRIFAQTKFNGDGILPPDSADNPDLQAIITDIITCFGAENDRSGKPGITQPKLDLFFTDANAFATWQSQPITDPAKSPLGPNTHAAAIALKAIAAKIEDFFARCRLSAFDPRAAAIISRDTADYATLAPKDLSSSGGAQSEIAAFPLARITPNAALPLNDDNAINPAWRESVDALRAQVIQPLLGSKDFLTEDDWDLLLSKFAPFDSWLAAKAGHTVEKLGLDRIRAILGNNEGSENKAAIAALIAKDAALAADAAAIASVDKLVHFNRDLYRLLNNFVSFRDFYQQQRHDIPGTRATFQIGTLYLDQRSCDLSIRVEDTAKHAMMAPLSRTYLAYCDCTRKDPAGATVETMTIAAAFTAGDSDNLMVGRNGVFWDRQGRDWDATITKIVDNPISIHQAFFSPYKRIIRWISEQMAKRAADADAAAAARMQGATGTLIDDATGKTVPPPLPPKPKIDVGVVAALGVAFGAITTAFGVFLTWLSGVSILFIPVYAIVLLLLISGPSMLIAFFKLRQRNLGPLLDANGWAVNAKAKINIPFGRSLTATPKLPPGSHRDLVDPYAEKHTGRNIATLVVVVLVVAWGAWYFGLFQHIPVLRDVFPKSTWVINGEVAAANREKADGLIKDVNSDLDENDLASAQDAMMQLIPLRPELPEDYKTQIDKLDKAVKERKKIASAAATKAATTQGGR